MENFDMLKSVLGKNGEQASPPLYPQEAYPSQAPSMPQNNLLPLLLSALGQNNGNFEAISSILSGNSQNDMGSLLNLLSPKNKKSGNTRPVATQNVEGQMPTDE